MILILILILIVIIAICIIVILRSICKKKMDKMDQQMTNLKTELDELNQENKKINRLNNDLNILEQKNKELSGKNNELIDGNNKVLNKYNMLQEGIIMNKNLSIILCGMNNKEIKELFDKQRTEINKLKSEDIKLAKIKNIINLAGNLLESLSERIRKANENEIKNFKLKSEYLQELIDELKELCVKINPKGCDDSEGSGNSTELSRAIGECIKSLKLYKDAYEKKELDNIKNRDDIADILLAASKLCKIADETIETVEEINTLCDILKEIAKLVSMLHPLLLQLQIKSLMLEFKIDQNFDKFVESIVEKGIKIEKENITGRNNVGPTGPIIS